MITQAAVSRLLLLNLCAAMAGCSWDAPVQTGELPEFSEVAAADTGTRAARVALQQRGSPYRFGGESPSGFDCSGLVHYAYRLVGKPVPRTTRELYRSAEPVGREDLQAGDLVFFRIDGKVSHVGIYVEDGHFVHAPQTGRTVSVESLDRDFYRHAFLGGGRLP